MRGGSKVTPAQGLGEQEPEAHCNEDKGHKDVESQQPGVHPSVDPSGPSQDHKPPPTAQHPEGRTPPAPSLDELNQSVPVPASPDASWHAKLLAFVGMGAMIAVGYMDPGNWAADINGGAQFGYTLLSVILASSVLAMFLQYLALKLGAATDRDLAQACRGALPTVPSVLLWLLTEVAIAATDLVGVAGSATALYLLFGLPVWAGVLVTAFDVLLLLFVLGRSVRVLELVVLLLLLFIAGSLVYELVLAKPNWGDVFRGFVPQGEVFQGALYSAVAILGATVMPHNLYLHSSLVQTRGYPRTPAGRQLAVKYATWDSSLSLTLAFLVNCAILVLAAAAFFYGNPALRGVADISDAYKLISTALGQDAARIVFAVALLAAGQSSSISGTLAGQIVMEGFVELKLQPWARRLLTRLVAIVPAIIVAVVGGPRGIGRLLVLSQVVLSIQLPFAVGPLVYFTSSKAFMGDQVNTVLTTILAWVAFFVITLLNIYLVIHTIVDWALF